MIFATPARCRYRGKLFSRWLSRLTRLRGFPLRLFQLFVLFFLGMIFEAFGLRAAGNVFYWIGACALWMDDIMTGDDQDPRWKHVFGKIKLKMPAPVKLRPVERIGGPI